MKKDESFRVPQSAIVLTSYSDLRDFAVKFADGAFNLLGVIGAAGLCKSRIFKAMLDPKGLPYCHLKGVVRPFILHQQLWIHRDQTIFLDDADSFFETRECRPQLKCLLETELEKTVSWQSRAIDDEEIPRTFTTKSRVLIICNQWQTVNQNMRAVEDRGIFIHFRPSVYEVHRVIGADGWFSDIEVYDFIGQNLHLITEPSARYYLKASEMKRAGIDDWQGWTLKMLNPDATRFSILSQLLKDEAYPNESSRVARYVELTGRSAASYYRDKELLDRAQAA